jgi:hypothetical protein
MCGACQVKEASWIRAKKLLLAIADHGRLKSRLHVYDLRHAHGPEAEIDVSILHAVVASIELDVVTKSRFKLVSSKHHMLRDPEPYLRRPCMADAPESTRYPPRTKTEEGALRENDWRHDHEWKFDDAHFLYSPEDYTDNAVIENSSPAGGAWADHMQPDHPGNRWRKLRLSEPGNSWHAGFKTCMDADGHERPINPQGRTGLRGRGSYALWGPNPSVDPILTRQRRSLDDPSMVVVEMLAERRANFQFGIPGVQFQCVTRAPQLHEGCKANVLVRFLLPFTVPLWCTILAGTSAPFHTQTLASWFSFVGLTCSS